MTTSKTKAVAPTVAYMGIGNIEKAIATLHTAGQSVQAEAHAVALSVLYHVGKHGDVRVVGKLVNGLLQAMPEMSRTNALRDWFAEFGPVTFGEKGIALYVKNKPTKMADAAAMPFWKFKVEAPYQALDIMKFVEQAIKKLTKDQTETKRSHGPLLKALETIKSEMTPAAQ
jgi:hypothetical protein